MDWLVSAVTASMIGTFILVFVYIYTYCIEKQEAIFWWIVSWSIYALRFVFMIIYLRWFPRPEILFLNQAAVIE